MSYRGRFAPSPTGPLHAGSLIAALASYLDARAHGGTWLVRMEDIDETRCHPSYAVDILHTLKVFGMESDEPVVVQTNRKAQYAAALHKLRATGLVYACACSRREIADTATTGLEGPVYPGTCRNRELPESGNAFRVRTSRETVSFVDLVQGEIQQSVETDIGDFVLKRRDGLFAYQLAVVVDDAQQAITHVVRGADLLDSTARQIHLQRLLGFPIPQYLHVPVAVNALGQKLSKQTLAPALIASPDAVRRALLSALRFLGQPSARVAKAGSAGELLINAAGDWDCRLIPRVRTRPFDPAA